MEHFFHSSDILCVEMRKVDALEFCTFFEHATHVRHPLCVKVFYTFDFSEVSALFKPSLHDVG